MAASPYIAESVAEPVSSDAIIVGAGPAGLAVSYELKRRGIKHLVFERGDRPGFAWTQLYDSLTLHTGRHLSHLPGLAMPRSVPLFAPREAFVSYLADYARGFDLPVQTGVEVSRVERSDGHWALTTNRGTFSAGALVMATGLISSPNRPQLAGEGEFKGQVMHSSQYRRPSEVPGPRVLVVGAGNSGGEIASELARAGRAVDIAVRSGVNVVPRSLAGIPIQYLAYLTLKFPKPVQVVMTGAVRSFVAWRHGPLPLPQSAASPLDEIPLIGFNLVDAIRAGRVHVRPGILRLTADGAQFSDGSNGAYDDIILATGFRAALAPLGDLIRRDARGFALRNGRVASADQPDLFMLGQNYDASGALNNIARDAGLAAEAIARRIAHRPR